MVSNLAPASFTPADEIDTIARAVEFAAARWPDRGYTFQDLQGQEARYSFRQVETASSVRAHQLQQLGLSKGDRLAMAVSEPEDFVLTFLAALRLGVIAVPIYPPLSRANLEPYVRRAARILDIAAVSVVAVSSSLKSVFSPVADAMDSAPHIVSVESLREPAGSASFPAISPQDVAFLQFTSGSTMDPRGVVVTHSCLLSNASGIVKGLDADGGHDIGVTWLPLYHDMGLVGFVITSICAGIPIVFIPTLRFLRNPSVWMDTMHRHRATISFAPNFAYALAARRIAPERVCLWDLSAVRVLGCGGEPVNPEVVRTFTRLFHKAGLHEDAVRPAYGLAEGTLTTSLTPMSHGMKTVRVDQRLFQEAGIVEPVRDARPSVEHVSVGKVISGHEVCVVASSDGTPLPEGREGEILVRGPSVASGYFNNLDASATVFRDGTLHTGDLGYLHRGYLYVTGRLKDLIIHNGRNIHPHSLEWVVERLDESLRGNVVAISVPDQGTERIIIVTAARGLDDTDLATRIKTAVQRELDVPVSEVICLGRGALSKTSSGKLQRHLTRHQYLAGLFEHAASQSEAPAGGADAARKS
jgi:fatty-acyl-CoA synthase